MSSQKTVHNDPSQLTEREQFVLRSVVQRFIETADPVGSRYVADQGKLRLSSASIRHTMSDLEERGYLDHPYTSAGRIPTTLGYRTYVDTLMERSGLSAKEQAVLSADMMRGIQDLDAVLQEGARLLGRFSQLLGIILSPRLSTGVLKRLEVVSLSSNRIMFVISIESGAVRTIIVEAEHDLQRPTLDALVRVLNERLAGLTLAEIKRTFSARVKDIDDQSGLIRLAMAHTTVLFSEPNITRRLNYAGTQYMITQPEFSEPTRVRDVIALLENEAVVVNLLEPPNPQDEAPMIGKAHVEIGPAHPAAHTEPYSVVKARYRMGSTVGTIGVIGPQRMDYARILPLVEHMAHLLDGAVQG